MQKEKPAHPFEHLLAARRIHIWGHLSSTQVHPPEMLPVLPHTTSQLLLEQDHDHF